ncbi:MAG: hypothetical protein L6Q57_03665 [Alphaproteobacteria bacterium]|nr:hypothetical protein [Alphaproteobacteria bacterium]
MATIAAPGAGCAYPPLAALALVDGSTQWGGQGAGGDECAQTWALWR